MPGSPPRQPAEPEFEGDYRPAPSDNPLAHLDPVNVRVEPADLSYLVQLADALNTTLDLQTLLNRTSELVRAIINYRIFAIFLLNDRTHELRMRFQIGHTKEAERMRFPLGKGVVGQVALTRQSILLNDVSTSPVYFPANPDVRSELAVPLIAKNRLIGVIDLESEKAGLLPPRAPAPAHAHRIAHRAGHRKRPPVCARLAPGANPDGAQRDLDGTDLHSRSRSAARTRRPASAPPHRLPDVHHHAARREGRDADHALRVALRLLARAAAPNPHHQRPGGRFGARMARGQRARRAQRPALPRNESRNALRDDRALCFTRAASSACSISNTPAPASSTKSTSACSPPWRRRSPSPSRMPASTRPSPARKNNSNATSPWRAKCNCGCCPRPRPSTPMPIWRCAFCPPAPSAAISTTFLEYGPNQTAIVLGDVSGKAAPAALFAALVSGIMRSAAHQQLQPAAMLAMLNDALQERRLESQYVVMLFAVWNDENQTLQVANSGAVQPIFCRAGEVDPDARRRLSPRHVPQRHLR